VEIAYRWAENQFDRLPVLAAELVRRQVAAIVASGGPAVTFAAKAATTTIPIVFLSAEDPVRLGLVTSFARPGGNLTGINFVNRELAAKQLELLRELVPAAVRLAVLVNPAHATGTESTLRGLSAFIFASPHSSFDRWSPHGRSGCGVSAPTRQHPALFFRACGRHRHCRKKDFGTSR
jgi:ABC transporter substrate binding protein